MMTHKQKMLAVMRGEMVDTIPFVPRLDLWWLANTARETVPKKYDGMMPDDISRAEGWPCYHMVPNFADISSEEDILHRAIGLFSFKQSAYGWNFSNDVEVVVTNRDGQQIVEYHTPLGMVRTIGGLTEEAKKAGSSLGWVQEHALKKTEDYKVLAHIFANLEVFPQKEGVQEYLDSVGDDGVVATGGPSLGASPMHLIQKELIDSTKFFYEYNDNYTAMKSLAESIAVYYDKVLGILSELPVEVVLWGANYDDMLTYPPYFRKEILPWLQKASSVLDEKGIIVATHTDGENQGLMDLIKESGVHVAESVTPYPMTKVKIEEYYQKWGDSLTIMGGIPECVLLEETASEDEFEAYLDHLFKSVAPGNRLILGTADSTPPDAKFDRLLRIAERVEKEGQLPLRAGTTNPISRHQMEKVASVLKGTTTANKELAHITQLVIDGDTELLKSRAMELVNQGMDAQAILNNGMIPAMEQIGERFKTGDVFIPEVLISARAMNDAMKVLEPYMGEADSSTRKRFLIGTVQGDLHDIGKNMVAILLRGVGFEIIDLGINVSTEEFVNQIEQHEPDIVGISALLTTTMPEMKNIIKGIVEKGLRERVKIMVGGAPVNQKYATEIGADGYAGDAGEAVNIAKQLVS